MTRRCCRGSSGKSYYSKRVLTAEKVSLLLQADDDPGLAAGTLDDFFKKHRCSILDADSVATQDDMGGWLSTDVRCRVNRHFCSRWS